MSASQNQWECSIVFDKDKRRLPGKNSVVGGEPGCASRSATSEVASLCHNAILQPCGNEPLETRVASADCPRNVVAWMILLQRLNAANVRHLLIGGQATRLLEMPRLFKSCVAEAECKSLSFSIHGRNTSSIEASILVLFLFLFEQITIGTYQSVSNTLSTLTIILLLPLSIHALALIVYIPCRSLTTIPESIKGVFGF